MTALKYTCTVGASTLLALIITSCGNAPSSGVSLSPTPFTTEPSSATVADHSASEISGLIRLIGGMAPGHTFAPRQAKISVVNTRNKVTKTTKIQSDHFKIMLPSGSYEVTVYYDNQKCGYPQRASIPSDTHLVLHFVCPMR